MQKRIHHLDSLTIDKIAAGEVIDVPASCVKELVENALDAGADDILIEIQLGGRELIRVRDSGSGMCRDDVLSSIERHATSKIVCVEDLEKISSMGFRGEALASIVAISRVKITSAEKIDENALQKATILSVEGGEIKSVIDTRSQIGTTVEVRDLFYNIPARRKFLKSPSKDTQDIIKMVTSLALSAPHVAMKLIVDGREVLNVPIEKDHSLILRIRSVLREPFKSGFEVNQTQEGFALCGIIAEPQAAKANRSGQYLFVNGRAVFSLPISYAVKSGFGTAIEQNKHPQFVFHLKLDPSTIDINVHPQKKEIRFADEEWVRSLVQEKVFEAMFGKNPPFFHGKESSQYSTDCGSFGINFPELKKLDSSVNLDVYAEPISFSVEAAQELFSLNEVSSSLPSFSEEVLAVIGDIALIQPKSQGGVLLLVDLKASMKAVLFKELMEQQGKRTSEVLLIPITFECTQEESFLLNAKLEEFEVNGFILRPFGPNSFLLESVPQGLSELDVQTFIAEALHSSLLLKDTNKETKCLRLAGLYVSLMKGLRLPISVETARAVYKRYVDCGSPKLSPDGSICISQVTSEKLKGFFKI